MADAPASNILSGLTRGIGGNSHQWRVAKDTVNTPWIRLEWEQPITVSHVQITFDSNFNIEKKMTMSSRRQNQQVVGVPRELVRNYEILLSSGGKIVATQKITGNYQRLNRVSFEPTVCDAVQINILDTNGDAEAKVFEIRVY